MKKTRILTTLQHSRVCKPEGLKGLKKETETRERQRIRDQISGAFEDLTLYLEKMPEYEKNLVFTEKNLIKFFNALFKYDASQEPEKERNKTHSRLVALSQSLIQNMGYLGEQLEPDLSDMVGKLSGQKSPIKGISALLLSQNWRTFKPIPTDIEQQYGDKGKIERPIKEE
jgi:hypothetical protein